MLRFTAAPGWFVRCGLGIALAQLCVFVSGFPPFHGGVWLQVEPTMAGIFALAALHACWIAAGLLKRWVSFTLHQPLSWIIFAWVGWQYFATLHSSLPWRSWFGSAQYGEGTAWWTAWLLSVMLMHALWQVRPYRRILLVAALLCLGILIAMHAFVANQSGGWTPWQPANWPDYLVFIAGYIWLAFMLTSYAASIRWRLFMFIILFAAIILASSKSGTMLVLPALSLSICIITLRPLRRFFYPSQGWRLLAILGCLFPLLWIGFTGYYPKIAGKYEANWFLDSLLQEKNGGLGSRVGFSQIAFSSFAHEPSLLWAGNGWGDFSDLSFKYVLIDDVWVFHNAKRIPNWFMVDGIAFHSHNQALEALLSLGLPGLILWLAIPMLIIWYLPNYCFWRCTPMIIALCALGALWFQLPQVLGFHAMAVSALLTVCRPVRRVAMPEAALRYSTVAAFALAALFSWSVWQQYTAIKESNALYDALDSVDPHYQYDASQMDNDVRRGGERLQLIIVGFTRNLIDRSHQGDLYDNDPAWMEKFIAVADHLSQTPHTNPRAASLALWLRFRVLADIDGDIFSDLRRKITASLTDAVMDAIKHAPLRDDLTAIFLMNLPEFTHGDINAQANILQKILEIAPNHRGALWVMGSMLATDPQTHDAGIDMQKHALESGAATVYPITYDEINALNKTR